MPYKLIYECPEMHKQYSVVNKVEMTLEDEGSLDEMLEAYKQFLQSTGFVISGDFTTVDPYEYSNGDNSEQPDW